MSTTLSTFITLHVSLMLLAAIAFYAMLLVLFSRRDFAYKALYRSTTLALVSVVLSELIAIFYLKDYFRGLIGHVTDPSVSSLVPLFAMTQVLLSVVLLAVAILAFITMWMKGHLVGESGQLKNLLVILSIIGVLSASALMFLGVLVP